MTQQVSDYVIYDDELYFLYVVRGDQLPTPRNFGIRYSGGSTACRRGSQNVYLIEDNLLKLDSIILELRPLKQPRYRYRYLSINGVQPRKLSDYRSCGSYEYRDINLPVSFTGNILLSADPILSMETRGPVQSPYIYLELLRVEFVKGVVQKIRDYSDRMKEIREALERRPSPPNINSIKDPEDWIEWVFSLD